MAKVPIFSLNKWEILFASSLNSARVCYVLLDEGSLFSLTSMPTLFLLWNILLVDYNLLEEVKRVAESAQRTRTKLCGYAQFKLPFHLRSLRNAAASRRTKLLLLPSGMSKREKNRTRYDQRLTLVIS